MDEGGVIYFIWNRVNGKRYVGQTTKPLEARMAQHMHGDIVVDKAIQKYGIENFRYGVIKTCATREELNYWEKYFIVALKSKATYGYNMTDGGDGVVGWTDEMRKRVSVALTAKKKSPEHCANLSAAQIERFKDPAEHAKLSASKSGEKHPFFGKHHTKEHCEHIAAGLRAHKRTPEHCANISKAKTGKSPKDETRDHMSESRSGEKNHNYGKPREQETCVQISAKNRAESVYPNLVAELEARQMTYTALATVLGLVTVSDKMRGRRGKIFSDEQTAKLVAFFGKPAEYLLYRDETICLQPVTDRRKSPYKNLIAEMDARNMSYPMLTEVLGSSKQSVFKKMRGERTFKNSEKKRLAEIFDKSAEYLLQRFE